ncbi:MAG: NUDIX domain-containing protein [Corallococcus sp.]|nr:NUDIX domain-containing protein [Bacillota bacterium]MCM1533191.1 NUDIX domain-containing protein [Corallococcus sp.]
MLVTKRHPNKKAGGLWEFVGGGVLAGETTERATVREIKEEIGICVAETDLHFLYEYRSKNYFMDIYLVNKDPLTSNLVLNKTETTDAKWVTEQELRKMIDRRQVVRSVAIRYNLLKDKLLRLIKQTF